MTEKTVSEYADLAENATEEVVFAYDHLGTCIAEYEAAQDQLLSMKHLIEDKKNRMIVAGEISGKNAEERAANAWIAITEYDDLVILESNASMARANYDIAKTKLFAWKRRLDFYMRMVELLAVDHLWSINDELGEEADYV